MRQINVRLDRLERELREIKSILQGGSTATVPDSLTLQLPKPGASYRSFDGQTEILIVSANKLRYVDGAEVTDGSFRVENGTNVVVTYKGAEGSATVRYRMTKLGLQDSGIGVWLSPEGRELAADPTLRNQCINTLRQIDGAKEQWALEKKATLQATPAQTDVLTYLRGSTFPTCPAGGTYTVGRMDASPKCNIPEHVLK